LFFLQFQTASEERDGDIILIRRALKHSCLSVSHSLPCVWAYSPRLSRRRTLNLVRAAHIANEPTHYMSHIKLDAHDGQVA
jgi:hypothetical protein